MLTLVTFFPVLGAVIILLLKLFKKESDLLVKQLAVGTAIVTFGLSIALLTQFNPALGGLQLENKADWIPSWGISYYLGIDGLSILMVLLTTFISMLAIASSWTAIKEQVMQYYIFMLLLEAGMLGVFLAQDLFLFYIFWEFTLIPMYFLIGIWGGKNRIYASIKFFLYTMAGSLLMLLAILYMGITNETFSLPELIAGRSAFAAV
ncbi:MAG: Fe-S-binding domain-containing protein, partial [Anaerolineales bacterium]|nr:Fe-S-binding domain-containing protein [Anaerolineales bacterium]